MNLSEYLDPQRVWVLDRSGSRDQALGDLAERISEQAPGLDPEVLRDALLAREAQGSTATPEGVAFPHAMVPGAERTLLAAALAPGGVDFGGDRTPPADLILVLVGPDSAGWEHVRLLARLARVCGDPDALRSLRAATDGEQLYRRLIEEDERHV